MSWIVMDLDGTLCDCSHRVHWAQAKQWEEFHAGIPEDKPNADAVLFLNAIEMLGTHSLIIVTGRDERQSNATWAWLRAQGLDRHFDNALFRPEGNHAPDHELKLHLVSEFFGSRENALNEVALILEDRDKVVEAWRDAGFRCWQVQAGSY